MINQSTNLGVFVVRSSTDQTITYGIEVTEDEMTI